MPREASLVSGGLGNSRQVGSVGDCEVALERPAEARVRPLSGPREGLSTLLVHVCSAWNPNVLSAGIISKQSAVGIEKGAI